MNITCKYNGELSFIIQNKYDYLLVNKKLKKDENYDIKISKKRNLKHHNKYRLCLKALSYCCGDSEDDLNEYFKDMFIPSEMHYNEKLKIEVKKRKSTSFDDMDQLQFNEYYQKFDNWLIEHGIIIEDLINSMPK